MTWTGAASLSMHVPLMTPQVLSYVCTWPQRHMFTYQLLIFFPLSSSPHLYSLSFLPSPHLSSPCPSMKGEAYLEFHPDRFVYFSYHSGRARGSKSEIDTRQGRVGRGIEKGGGGGGGYSLLVNWEEVYAGLCPENTYFGQIIISSCLATIFPLSFSLSSILLPSSHIPIISILDTIQGVAWRSTAARSLTIQLYCVLPGRKLCSEDMKTKWTGPCEYEYHKFRVDGVVPGMTAIYHRSSSLSPFLPLLSPLSSYEWILKRML